MNYVITVHAQQRGRERLNLGLRSLERMMERVFYFGIGAEQAHGRVARYLAEKESEIGTIVRAYGHHLYVFAQDPTCSTLSLKTVYEVPVPLRPLLRKHRLACAA